MASVSLSAAFLALGYVMVYTVIMIPVRANGDVLPYVCINVVGQGAANYYSSFL